MEKFKVSQLAKIFGVSRQTLLYYDNIGLLKPEYTDEENGYRYYGNNQIMELSFIIVLKEAGLSLKEIKEYVACGDMKESLDFLQKKEGELQRRIRTLEKARKKIKSKIVSLEELKKEAVDKPKIEKEGKKYIVELDVDKNGPRYEMDIAFLEVDKKAEELGIVDYEVSVTVALNNVLNERFFEYETIAFTVENGTNGGVEVGGRIVGSLIHRLSFDRIDESYKKLLEYIKEKGYEPWGDSREYSNKSVVFMGDGIGALTKITIPVRKREK